MTVKKLRELLAKIHPDCDSYDVEVWLPGSYIALEPKMMIAKNRTYLIEGNLKPGSALE